MSVDVIYQGLAIARNAAVRVEGAQLFIELDSPMPVATELALQHEGNRLVGRVARVHEGAFAGVHLAPSGRLPDWIRRLQPRAVETVEIEAEPDEVEIAAAAQAQAPAATPAQAAASPAPAQDAASAQTPVTAPAPAAEPAAEAAAPAQDPEPAAEAASAASPAPFEPTLEISVPSEEDGKLDGDAEPSGAPRPGKKKKSSRKR